MRNFATENAKTLNVFTNAGNKRKAFSLTEGVMVIGVSAFVLGAVWLGASSAWENYKTYRTRQQIITVVKNLRNMYGASGKQLPGAGTSVDMTEIAKNEGLLPQEMINTSGEVYHALVGTFAIRSNDPFPGNVSIRLSGLKKKNCMEMLMNFPVLDSYLGVSKIGTGTKNVVINTYNISNPTSTGEKLPIDIETASAWCSSEGRENEVQIGFRVR